MRAENVSRDNRSVKLHWITIDHRVTFHEHAATAINKSRSLLSTLQKMAFSKRAFMLTLHQRVHRIFISTLMCGKEVRWTGAKQRLDKLNTTYRRFAWLIKYLPPWTRSNKLLAAAAFPSPHLILNLKSRLYRIRLLETDSTYLNKITLRKQLPKNGVGLGRIKTLLYEITPK